MGRIFASFVFFFHHHQRGWHTKTYDSSAKGPASASIVDECSARPRFRNARSEAHQRRCFPPLSHRILDLTSSNSNEKARGTILWKEAAGIRSAREVGSSVPHSRPFDGLPRQATSTYHDVSAPVRFPSHSRVFPVRLQKRSLPVSRRNVAQTFAMPTRRTVDSENIRWGPGPALSFFAFPRMDAPAFGPGGRPCITRRTTSWRAVGFACLDAQDTSVPGQDRNLDLGRWWWSGDQLGPPRDPSTSPVPRVSLLGPAGHASHHLTSMP
eukprot:scaffold64_cov338-Pavlova_lutheri.AAC.72